MTVPSPTFRGLVLKHFRRPIEDNGFICVEEFGEEGFYHQALVFESGCCQIEFIVDRGDVYIKVTSTGSADVTSCGHHNPWYNIDLVVALLTPGMTTDQLLHFYPTVSPGLSTAERVDQRLAEYAQKTWTYWGRLLDLCRTGELNRHAKELEELERRRGEAYSREAKERLEKAKGSSNNPSA